MTTDIIICTPYSTHLDPEHDMAVGKLQSLCREKGIHLSMCRPMGCSAVDQARAVTAATALEDSDAAVLLWLDSDVLFVPEDALRICELAHGKGIVGGAYAVKRPASGRMAVTFLPGTPSPLRFFEGGSLVEVRGMGFGFIAIHRRVFERMAEDFPLVDLGGKPVRGWFLPEIDDGCYKSEDISFCDRARRAGFQVWLDTRVRLYHKGFYAYSLEDMAHSVGLARSLDVSIGDRSWEEAQQTLEQFLKDKERLPELIEYWRGILRRCSPKEAGYPVDHDAAAFLMAQACNFPGEIIVEYGCGTGYSGGMLSAGGMVHSYDDDEKWLEVARRNTEGLQVSHHHIGVDFRPLPPPADLVFIDADDDIRPDVLPTLIANERVGPSSRIFVHDAFRQTERTMLDNWCAEFGCTWSMALGVGRGIAQVHLT